MSDVDENLDFDGDDPRALQRDDSVASFSSVSSSVQVKSDTNPYVTLNNSVKMPMMGLGTFQVKSQNAHKVPLYALRLGYRLIDTARVYKNELMVGRAIKDSRIPRNEIFVTSKLSPADHGHQNAKDAFYDSLEDLGLDYIDLYLIHWPACQGIPVSSDLNAVKRKESWKALEQLYKEGKVRAIGVSNYTVEHLKQLLEYAEVIPQVNQVELHPLLPQTELVEFCKQHNIIIQPYSSLGQGRLLESEEILQIAKKRMKSPAAVCLRWAVQKGFPVIPKSLKASRLLENTKVFDWELSPAEMKQLDEMESGTHFCWDPSGIP